MAKALEGKIAAITGGNSGMGLATAKRFVAEGARVVITGRRQEQIDLALKEIGSSNAVGVQGDVGKMKDLDRLILAAAGRQPARAASALFSSTQVQTEVAHRLQFPDADSFPHPVKEMARQSRALFVVPVTNSLQKALL